MSEMRMLALVLAVLGFVVGLLAAAYWFRASCVEAVPIWGEQEPVDPIQSQAGWVAGQLKAGTESANLNKIAARLTAAAVVLTTGATLAGLFT
jgi:hypothetical protein